MRKLTGFLILTCMIVASMLTACTGGGNIPVGVYELPDNENFDADAAPGHLVIVDFHADWCGNCKIFMPMFEEAAKRFEGKAEFVSIDADKHAALVNELKVSALPAVLFIMPDGQKNWHIGLMDNEEFTSEIESALRSGKNE